MKGKKHKPDQIIQRLREADAMLSAEKTIGQVCQSLSLAATGLATLAGIHCIAASFV